VPFSAFSSISNIMIDSLKSKKSCDFCPCTDDCCHQ